MVIYAYNPGTQEYFVVPARRAGHRYKYRKGDEYELTPAEQAAREQDEAVWENRPVDPPVRDLKQELDALAARVTALETARGD